MRAKRAFNTRTACDRRGAAETDHLAYPCSNRWHPPLASAAYAETAMATLGRLPPTSPHEPHVPEVLRAETPDPFDTS